MPLFALTRLYGTTRFLHYIQENETYIPVAEAQVPTVQVGNSVSKTPLVDGFNLWMVSM